MNDKENKEEPLLLQNRLYEDFQANFRGWQEVDNKEEFASIDMDHYILKNRDIDRWHHFSLFPDIPEVTGLYIRTLISIDPESHPGQFGLIWGFDPKMKRLNRFTLTSTGKGASVVHFERNHRPVFHRFYDHYFSVNTEKRILMEIREDSGYFYFTINRRLAYIGHTSHFVNNGYGVGFYLDPGVSIKVKKLQVATIVKPDTVFSLN